MNPCADGNPERNENAGETDQAKGNATRSYANSKHSHYKGVDSKKLEAVYEQVLAHKDIRRGDTRE